MSLVQRINDGIRSLGESQVDRRMRISLENIRLRSLRQMQQFLAREEQACRERILRLRMAMSDDPAALDDTAGMDRLLVDIEAGPVPDDATVGAAVAADQDAERWDGQN